MDFIIPDDDIIEKHENILIHAFYHLLNYDFRDGMFTDESSIYDMGSCGLQDNDYLQIAKEYEELDTKGKSYLECQKIYYKLVNNAFDKRLFSVFKQTYGFELNPKIHLLKDIAILLKETLPKKNWDEENIFILKRLNIISEQREKKHQEEQKTKQEQNKNITKFPRKKHFSDEEVAQGTNCFLMMKQLGISFDEANKLVDKNLEKRYEGKTFTPYKPS